MSNFVAFLSGVGIGSVVTWALLKNKYEQMFQEECDDFDEFDDEPEEIERGIRTEAKSVDEAADNFDDYKNIAKKYDTKNNENEEEEKMKPYVITPEEFDTNDEYDTISLTYYEGDGVLADDCDEAMDDDEIERTVGYEALNHFGEYEDDSVFVRNEELKTDYEILLDVGSFSDK